MSRLRVVQLDRLGLNDCAMWTYPEQGELIYEVRNVAHHAKLFHQLTVAPSSTCGQRFRAWVDVGVFMGNPIKIEPALNSGWLSVAGIYGL